MTELPREPGPLVGRDEELRKLAELSQRHALVSIVGAPGIGKSRLARDLARRMPEAHFVDVSNVPDAAVLSERLSQVVSTSGVVVLDGFDGLVGDGALALAGFIDRDHAPRFVVATRQRLRLSGECVFDVGPLELPSEGGDAECAAVELLIARLRLSQPDLEPSHETLVTMRELVCALEGNPLAIELAAARVPALSIDELIRRMPNQLDLLSRGSRDREPAGASLRSSIDRSWQRLSDEQRRALARCSVFAGSFSLSSGEAVLGGSALDRLQDLLERSLLHVPQAGRYRLFAGVRAFAAEQLDELGETRSARAAHRAWFLPRAERGAAAFEEHGEGLDELERERDEVLAAIEDAFASGDVEAAVAGVSSLGVLLGIRGPAELHRSLVERGLALCPDEPRLLCARGALRRASADGAGAARDLNAALVHANDDTLRATIHKELGTLHQLQRDIDAARECYRTALMLARAEGRRRMAAALVANLGALDHDMGCFEEASERYDEALDLLRAVGDRRLEAIALTNLGVLEQEQGGRERARRHYQRALGLLADARDPRYEAVTLGNLGVLEHELGNLEAAHACHRRALPLLRQVGAKRSEALCLARMGAVMASADRVDAAEAAFDEAERLTLGRDPLGLSLVRLHRCFLDLARGDEAAAYGRLEAAQTRADDESPSLVEVSDDARMVLRMLAAPLSTGEGPRLKVGPDAEWFKPPGSGKQDLSKFAAARRILERLTEERLARPGAALSTEDLFAAGWPDVRISATSAANRLHVQLAKLRKLGLKLVLLRDDEGYFLDPHTPLIRELEREA